MPTLSPERSNLSGEHDALACRRLLKHGSRSFYAASLLLPQPYRDGAIALYAFCRQADDAIDDGADPERALEEFNGRVDAIYRGAPEPHAADRALAAVVERWGLPRALLDAMLEGFAWDCRGRSYENFSSLLDYAARVAGSVGVMMAVLMGQREPAVLARAADLGSAMQLTNIARDVGEDARAGRIYLPLAWLQEHKLDRDELLSRPTHSDALGDLVGRLLTEADSLYRRAEAGISRLPMGCRPCVFAARLLYAEIGHEVLRRNCDSVSQRAVVSAARKGRVLAGLGRVAQLDPAELRAPMLPENAFLVAAVQRSPAPRPVASAAPEETQGFAWVLTLIQELERREQNAVYVANTRPRRVPVARPTRRMARSGSPVAAS